MAYEHGIYNETTDTEVSSGAVSTTAAQVVIGTAPVHLLSDPSAAVNTPILCESMADVRSKLGYSTDFEKYTLCQAAYASFSLFSAGTVVFINVLDPSEHYTAVEAAEYAINDSSVTIEDSVIVDSLAITVEGAEITDYETEWVDGVLTINFADDELTGTATISYNRLDASKVNENDIIGAWDTETDARTGAEVIKKIYPMLGVIPFIITAPGWSTSDTVGAVLAVKAAEINGCYKGMFIADLDSTEAKTRAAAIELKNSRTFDENCIACFPMVKAGGYALYLSSVLAALIMYQATKTDGVTCKSPSNQAINIDDVILADGTSVYYDQEDGNELNAEGIVTVIARNGWYTWGNDTAAYPTETDLIKRRIMTRLSFLYIENDFINTNFSQVDGGINKKMIENMMTDENIKLASYANAGYIVSGKMYYNAGDNSDEDILNGHFTFRTDIAANIPMEKITNIFSFDVEALEASILA